MSYIGFTGNIGALSGLCSVHTVHTGLTWEEKLRKYGPYVLSLMLESEHLKLQQPALCTTQTCPSHQTF